tara:strand:+ start:1457 stop:2056 length:600 start_codon:yes stop_codon:yes gene_type:complete
MANTTNLGIIKPTVGADTDTWGGIVNTGLDDIDALFADDGTGTSVGVHVGVGKTLVVAGNVSVTGTFAMTGDQVQVSEGGTGATTAAVALVNLGERTGATGSLLLPAGTTGERDVSPSAGFIRWNSSDGTAEVYSGTAWGSVGGGATGGGGDAVFVENDQALTTNYTIPVGKNASSVGPITVPGGVSVTVSSGSRWVVL